MGPASLESFARARLGNANVYGFLFESPRTLNLSVIDSAELASGSTNQFASEQLACIDDLLFNPIPEGREFERVAELVKQFGRRLINFVVYGLVFFCKFFK